MLNIFLHLITLDRFSDLPSYIKSGLINLSLSLTQYLAKRF